MMCYILAGLLHKISMNLLHKGTDEHFFILIGLKLSIQLTNIKLLVEFCLIARSLVIQVSEA